MDGSRTQRSHFSDVGGVARLRCRPLAWHRSGGMIRGAPGVPEQYYRNSEKGCREESSMRVIQSPTLQSGCETSWLGFSASYKGWLSACASCFSLGTGPSILRSSCGVVPGLIASLFRCQMRGVLVNGQGIQTGELALKTGNLGASGVHDLFHILVQRPILFGEALAEVLLIAAGRSLVNPSTRTLFTDSVTSPVLSDMPRMTAPGLHIPILSWDPIH
jgi:hypothetical protein